MSIILKRDAAPEGLRTGGERSGTQEWSAQEGPRNTELFWLRGTSVPEAGLERPKDQRTFGPRSRVDRSGSSQEGAVRWKATPELVSQDREAGTKPFYGAGPGRPNTGISFARRSGGWQQCRPPFLFWAWQQCRPLFFWAHRSARFLWRLRLDAFVRASLLWGKRAAPVASARTSTPFASRANRHGRAPRASFRAGSSFLTLR